MKRYKLINNNKYSVFVNLKGTMNPNDETEVRPNGNFTVEVTEDIIKRIQNKHKNVYFRPVASK